MLCQNCNKREATVHIVRNINGNKTEIHLCDECAKQQDISLSMPFVVEEPMSIQNILESFFDMMSGVAPQSLSTKICPICNMSFDDFKRTGMFGCSNCYNTFKREAMPVIKRIHGNVQHTGKIPGRSGSEMKKKREIEALKEELKVAISNEEYEKAAVLRDKIRDLEGKQGNN